MFFMSLLLNITVSFVMILVRMFRKCERYFILKYCKSKGQHETWSSLFYLFLTLHPQTGLRDVGAEVLFANRLARCRYTVYRYTVHNENLWKINEKTPNIISFLKKCLTVQKNERRLANTILKNRFQSLQGCNRGEKAKTEMKHNKC